MLCVKRLGQRILLKAREVRFGFFAGFRGSQRMRRTPNRIKVRFKFRDSLALRISTEGHLQTRTAPPGACGKLRPIHT
jgi:hypothetical protein